MSRRKRVILIVCAVSVALMAGGVYFGTVFWKDHEFYVAKWQGKQVPAIKIGDQTHSYGEFYNAIDTARVFGVPADRVVEYYFLAELDIAAGRKLKIFPTGEQIRRAEGELFKPMIGGAPLPAGFPTPLIYTEASNWKTLQSTARAAVDVAKETGREDEFNRARGSLYKATYILPLEEYPEGR